MSGERTLELCQVILKVQVMPKHVSNTSWVQLRLSLLHLHTWLPIWVTNYFLNSLLKVLVGYGLQTYAEALLGRFKHFLGLFETMFVVLTHLVDMLGHVVLFLQPLKFW